MAKVQNGMRSGHRMAGWAVAAALSASPLMAEAAENSGRFRFVLDINPLDFALSKSNGLESMFMPVDRARPDGGESALSRLTGDADALGSIDELLTIRKGVLQFQWRDLPSFGEGSRFSIGAGYRSETRFYAGIQLYMRLN